MLVGAKETKKNLNEDYDVASCALPTFLGLPFLIGGEVKCGIGSLGTSANFHGYFPGKVLTE